MWSRGSRCCGWAFRPSKRICLLPFGDEAIVASLSHLAKGGELGAYSKQRPPGFRRYQEQGLPVCLFPWGNAVGSLEQPVPPQCPLNTDGVVVGEKGLIRSWIFELG